MAPRISVLMPVKDPHPEFFRAAVASILSQTFADFELIITEDPGERSAAHEIAEFADSRIVYQSNDQRTSLIEQRNLGLSSARADIVALADADDVSEPNRLAVEFDYLTAHDDIDVIGSDLAIIDAEARPLGYRNYPSDHRSIVGALRRYNPIAQPTVMVRKSRVLAVGGYQYRKYSVNSDYDLWCRMALAGARFTNLSEALVRYRIHAGGLKTSKLRDVIAATIDIKKTHFAGALGARGQARIAIEQGLLLLPPAWVLKAFVATQYRGRARRTG